MPTFTAGHFEALGAAVRIARNDIRDKEPEEAQRDLQDGVSYAAERIADALARGNPRFDRARFLTACGVIKTNVYESCGCCDHYHPQGFMGDCRDDANRYTLDDITSANVGRQYRIIEGTQ